MGSVARKTLVPGPQPAGHVTAQFGQVTSLGLRFHKRTGTMLHAAAGRTTQAAHAGGPEVVPGTQEILGDWLANWVPGGTRQARDLLSPLDLGPTAMVSLRVDAGPGPPRSPADGTAGHTGCWRFLVFVCCAPYYVGSQTPGTRGDRAERAASGGRSNATSSSSWNRWAGPSTA